MLYKSLKNNNYIVEFDQAMLDGLAPNKGLYYPIQIPILPNSFIEQIKNYNLFEISLKIIKYYIGNCLSNNDILDILKETLKFPFPIHKIHDNIYSLELFHGPTLAFKDVGAKFLASCIAKKLKKNNKKIRVLVATSGDTGGAVAHGFYNVSNIEVIILYPTGKISTIQEKQIATLGNNIKALEIQGTFDDCQKLVKNVFLDNELKQYLNITSANSINVARLLPQMFYYFDAFKRLKKQGYKIIFSVPSGNFGNIFAGLLSKAMGLPINHFIAATNINDTIPRYMQSGIYQPYNTYSTISNAMDISDPSNFVRIQELYHYNLILLKQDFSAYSFSDEETLNSIIKVQKNYNYILDPHGAIGYLGLLKYLSTLKNPNNVIGIFLETAHPIKFIDKMPDYLKNKIDIPKSIKNCLMKNKKTIKLSNNYAEFKDWLLKNHQ